MTTKNPVDQIQANQTVFGYLVGTRAVQKPGRLITEYPDGDRWIKEYELVDAIESGETPWYLQTEAGKFLVVTTYANRTAIEDAAPEGFKVVWKTEPPKKRGRKPKKPPEIVQFPPVSVKTSEDETDDEIDDEIEEL